VGTIAKTAFKNLSRQKKRSILLGGAIAFGIMIVTIINGFAGAFQGNIASNIAELFSGHVFVEGVEKSPTGKSLEVIHDDAPILAAVAAAELDSNVILKRSGADATIVFEGKRTTQSIISADFAADPYLSKRLGLKAGKYEDLYQPGSLVLSEKIATKIKVELGDKVLVQLKTINGQNNVGELTLRGLTYDMGLFSNMLAYADMKVLNELLALGPGEYTQFGLLLGDLKQAEAAAVSLTNALKAQGSQVFELKPTEGAATTSTTGLGGGMGSRYMKLSNLAKKEIWEGTKYRVFTINDMISMVEEIVRVIDTVSLVILLVLFLIIMVGISNTFRMVMYERIREIGTIRALGMQRPAVLRLFLLEAIFLAAGGAVAGFLVSGFIMLVISLFDFGTGTLFAFFMKDGHLSFYVPPLAAIGNFLIVLALSILAAFFPARKASRLDPAVALRTSK
jgi:putative ABC transport system permease protein